MKMSNEHYPYLCGGILLNLLIEAKKPAISSREKLNGKKSLISDADILKGLIKLVTGEEVIASSATLKKDTSEYKKCNINSTSIITFTEASTVATFRDKYFNHCWELVEEVAEFIDTYLFENKLNWLIKSLLEIIISDNNILDEHKFLFSKDQHIRKIDICSANIKNIEIEFFIISVLVHIILIEKDNTLGKYTFKKLYKQDTPRTPWKLSYPIGQSITIYAKIERFKKENFIIENNNITTNNRIPTYENSEKVKPLHPIKNFKISEPIINYRNVNYNFFNKKYFYNLIVGGIENATFRDETKTNGYFLMKKERVLNLWCDDLVKPLAKLGIKERDILTSFPTIFAIDQGPNGHKDGDLAHYGFIRKISVLGDNAKIVFEIISSFSQHELYKYNFEFGIEDFELYNTHWSVKEIDLEDELNNSDIDFF